MKKEENIKCKCGYRWNTRSKLKQVSCPSCCSKVLNPQYIELLTKLEE